MRRQPAQIAALCQGIVVGARPLAERKGVELRVEGLDALPVVHVDPEAFEKVLVNLLGNALKFTDRGGSITVRGHTEEGGVHLVVADTGIGLPTDQLGRIFDRFAQVDGSTTRQHEGTGIGLSLVSELVGLHQGRIWAESEGLGHGAQMHLWLPLGESDVGSEDALAEAVDPSDRPALQNAIAGMGGRARRRRRVLRRRACAWPTSSATSSAPRAPARPTASTTCPSIRPRRPRSSW